MPKHPMVKSHAVNQPDFFLATANEPPLRDNRDVMEYPFLALQKRRTKPIKYATDHVHMRVSGDVEYGIATIWDWDIIIGLFAQVNDAIERNLPTSPRIQFIPYNLLRAVGRTTGGEDYRKLAKAIRRLRMTTVITNVRYEDGAGEERPFSWVADYVIPKRYSKTVMTPDDPHGDPDPSRPWEVELPPWLMNAILAQ